MVLGTLLLRNRRELLLQLPGFLVVFGKVIDLARELLQPVLQDVVGDLFFVERDHFLDGAHALFQVVAHRQQFVNHDRRARERLEHAQLPALDPLRDLHFALARKQGHSPHLPQIHADGVVGFFQGAGGEVEFDIFGAFFGFLEFFIECGGRHFRAFEHVDTLRTDSGQQIVQVFGAVHIVRDQVIDLIVGQVSLFFACVDQLFNVVVLVVKSQDGLSSKRPGGRPFLFLPMVGRGNAGLCREAQTYGL